MGIFSGRGPRTGARVIRTDWGFLFIVFMLIIFGLVMVYSASYGFALYEGGEYEGRPTHFFQRQVMFMAVGLVAMMITWRIDYRFYRRIAREILYVCIVVLTIMAIVIRSRWVFSTAVQPVELVKVGAMIYIAVWLASRGEQIRDITLGLVPFSVLLGGIAGLIVAQPDYSTMAILVATATAMFFVAGADMKQLLIGFVFGGMALILVALLAPYRTERIVTFLRNPLTAALDEGFQTVQSLAALNTGGLVGIGLGQSQQKFSIYAPHTDGMFAIIGEELGFLGAALVIGLYGLWTWRGLRIAFHAEDTYGTLLAVGLVCWVTIQAALHIGVITATTPFTGTVLPLISYGGSSLTTCLASAGILLNISASVSEGAGRPSGAAERSYASGST